MTTLQAFLDQAIEMVRDLEEFDKCQEAITGGVRAPLGRC
jgi:hypothetical protein